MRHENRKVRGLLLRSSRTSRWIITAIVAAISLWLAPTFDLRVAAQGETAEGPLPLGPDVNLVYANCQVCHNLRYVTESKGMPAFLWEDTVNLMIQLGMRVTDEEKMKLLTYLTTYMGPNPPPAPPLLATTGDDTLQTDEGHAQPGETLAGVTTEGESLYTSNCASCHQPNGLGVPGVFPPLVGHIPALYNAEGGRDYLPTLLLYGLQGRIEVLGESYTNVMPAWAHLSDTELAAILNHLLTAWENDALLPEEYPPYTTEEVTAKRDQELDPHAVIELRPDTGGR